MVPDVSSLSGAKVVLARANQCAFWDAGVSPEAQSLSSVTSVTTRPIPRSPQMAGGIYLGAPSRLTHC